MTDSSSWVPVRGPLHAEHRSTGHDHPPLILLHGFTQTSRSWDPFLEYLRPDWPVIRVDLPGHGSSGHADADLDHIADLVVDTCGAGIYLGYSMGGRVALHIALRHPPVVSQLMLIGATPGIIDSHERAERRRQDEALADEIEREGVPAFIERWLGNPLFAGLPRRPADVEDRRRNTAHGLAESLRHAGTGTQRPLWGDLEKLTMPVTVIVGAEDHKFTAIGHDMVTAIGPNGSLHLVDSAGHSAHLERPDAVAHLVNDIL